ncbi:hypothetical protein LguiA_023595 [Lonicera macranthoides]
MAEIFRLFTVTILLFSLANTVTAVTVYELESMINALRARGYNLFGNAIITSDLNYEILAGTSFTLFAPTDSSLFALDMTATASDYVTALHFHVVPRRFSLFDLRNIPSGTSLRSLDPSHDIVLESRGSLANDDVMSVDGIAIAVPDLFYGRDIVVHGLGGIISLRSQIGSNQGPSPMNMTGNESNDTSQSPPEGHLHDAAPPPVDLVDFGGFEPSSNDEIDYVPVVSPLPEPASVNGFSPVNSPGSVASPVDDLSESVSSPVADSPVSVTPPVDDLPQSDGSAFDISPAYAFPPDIPADLDLAVRTEAPPSSVSKGKHHRHHHAHHRRGSKSKVIKSDLPSSGKHRNSLLELADEGETESNGVYGEIQAIVREGDLSGSLVPAPENYWPYVEKTVDCALTDNEVAETMTCAQL